MNTADQFWAKVDRSAGSDACWLWQGRIYEANGYGYVFWRGARSQLAHRIAWTLTRGDPRDLFIYHTCSSLSCCNPRHLSLRTPIRGERVSTSRLTDAHVRLIRQHYANGISVPTLARFLGMHPTTIRDVCLMRSWRHVA